MSEQISNRNVIIAVDVQNDFVSGSLAVPHGAEVIDPLNSLAAAARRQDDGIVIYTRDWHPAVTPHFDAWPVHCVAETDGAAWHPDLVIGADDIVISKGMGQTDGYSGTEGISIHGQTIEQLVQPLSPREHVNVYIGGLATDYCVKATAIDVATMFADDQRVRTYVIRDAVRAVNLQPGDNERAMEAMAEANIQALSSTEILKRFF